MQCCQLEKEAARREGDSEVARREAENKLAERTRVALREQQLEYESQVRWAKLQLIWVQYWIGEHILAAGHAACASCVSASCTSMPTESVKVCSRRQSDMR